MKSPQSCLRCSKPLALESASGLCPVCLVAIDTSGSQETFHSSVGSGSPTASFAANRKPGAAGSSGDTGVVSLSEAGAEWLPTAPLGYQLVRQLGHGGMGDVYLAREQSTERVVAMKFLRGPSSRGSMDRFHREVRALARLEHPNIVRVLATDFYRSDPFFTMDYASCGPLSDRVKDFGCLAADEAARIVAAIARAVHAAHESDVLHRDLKPSNILLMEDGTPKVSDFGLAKRTDVDEDLTSTGPIGTPSFMPPEQASTEYGDIGPRSDVYSLGATLYYLLTGRPPFQGKDQQEILRHVLSVPPARPRSLRPDLPLELEAIVVKCLEKQPESRYLSAAALADDLDRYLAGQVPEAPPLTRWRRTRRWVGRNRGRLAVAGMVIAAALVIGAATRNPQTSPNPSGDIDLPPWPAPTPNPSKEIVQKRRDELTRGPVALVGSAGLPEWYWWRLGNGRGGTFTPSLAKGAFAVAARTECLLELFPDPGIDRYRITVELCHERILGSAPPRDKNDMPRVGLYLGHEQRPGPSGAQVHTTSIIGFSDLGPNPPDPTHPQRVHFWDDLLFDSVFAIPPFHISRGMTPLSDVAELPGPWRRIDIEVSPERVEVSLDGRPFAVHDAATLLERNETLQSEVNTRFRDGSVRLAGWNPRSPFGIWLYGAQVGVRNVTITPSRLNP